jgi:hypothetical protein
MGGRSSVVVYVLDCNVLTFTNETRYQGCRQKPDCWALVSSSRDLGTAKCSPAALLLLKVIDLR